MGAGMGPMEGMMDPMDMGTVMDGVRNPMCGELDQGPHGLLRRKPSHPASPRRNHPLDQRRLAAPVDHPGNETTGWPQGVAVSEVPDMQPGP